MGGESKDPHETSEQPPVGGVPRSGSDPTTGGPPFKDRSTGLIVLGVLQVLLGGCCALLVPLMLLGTRSGATSVRMLLPAVGIYGLLAVMFVSLGIGSILARRWARALTLVLAWMWLVPGGVSLITVAFWMPNMFQGDQMPPSTKIAVQATLLGTLGCLYLVLPGIFVAFYQSQHVKATCELKDPHVRWTDKAPLPVLALSLLLAFGALSMVWTLAYGPVLPLFGILWKGLPAGAVVVAGSLLMGYLAWGAYKLKMAAWWTTLAVYVVFGLSAVITFSRIPLMELYRAMNFPEEQLKLLERSGAVERMNMPLMIGVSSVVLVGYLLFVRQYFISASASRNGEG